MLSATQAIAQSRNSRGFFDVLLQRNKAEMKPTYDHSPHSSACRVYGTIEVKKVTANLHITTLGHGYASREHTAHNRELLFIYFFAISHTNTLNSDEPLSRYH